ncbi:ATP/GTP-binding protein [Streptomyces niveus]|uniref:ATP/GTP-binding protein n=1 Tax=Streptomyces niveus TaxID=193462 RepID=UPI0036AFBDB3
MADHEGHAARRPRLLTRRAAVALAASLTLLALPGLAQADDDPVVGGDCASLSQFVTACAQTPPTSGGDTQARSGAGAGGSGQARKPAPKCKIEKIEPPPPAIHLGWKGHKPGDGAVYRIFCPETFRIGTFWAADEPEAEMVDPAVLAQQALDRMKLTGPDIIISPRPGGRGLVGMPVWLAAGQSPAAYGPTSASASAGGVTVNVSAKVSRIVWDMGDGTTVACDGPGKPYKKAYGLARSQCGHIYTRPSPAAGFTVTATSTWDVDWEVTGPGGATGELDQVRESQVAVDVVESQAVNS